ncbi:hypothetical protein [Elizabethkingia meningoseptica]|uniref:hypothetical protein n=1 Tax=Elizabethkingia meningoseptica TaxID=238 RepID=UPI000935EFF2|nr:hypothetical protein [Elizabethkingia meningoseptica]MDE5487585.1 hypothetical protein [Elizabethkingia meningoseptica]MVW90623.1 hypothetical protein [Elizabethkingia meningoseptica]
MKTISNHFIFRINQCFRILNFQPKAILPLLIIIGILIVVKIPNQFNQLYPVLFFLLVLGFHLRRKDIPFLRKVFIKNWRLIVFIESALLYAVLLFGNIHYKTEQIGLLLFPGLIGFQLISIRNPAESSFRWNFIPDQIFEWRSLLRKNTWASIVFYLIAIASAYHISTLIFCGLFIIDIFPNLCSKNESKEMFEMYFKKYSFNYKLRQNLKFLNLLLIPVSLVFLILNKEESLAFLCYVLFFNIFFLLTLTHKYKVYYHKNKSNQLDTGTYLLYFIYTITIIPALVFIIENTKAAKENIKMYAGN